MIQRFEPLWWILFGAGGFIAAFTIPGLITGLFLLGPLGFFESGLAYERVLGLATQPLGRVFLIAVISLTLWHSAHHLRHLCIDLGVGGQGAAYGSYGFALLGTIAAFVITLGL